MHRVQDDARIIIFRSRLRAGVDAVYAERADAMHKVAESMPGFVSSADFVSDDGERLALIEFDSPEHLRKWRVHDQHRATQAEGRAAWYDAYTLQVCAVLRESTFDRRKDVADLPPVNKGPLPTVIAEGGCACGALRYRVMGPVVASTLCHCADCRRACGATPVGWLTLARSGFTWLAGTPKRRASSPPVVRDFCGDCGAQLVYASEDEPEYIDVTLGSLDDPDLVPPRAHIWTSSKAAWLHLRDELWRFPKGLRDGKAERYSEGRLP
jgi:heme-degrading monooxygenase HmoA